MANEEQGIKPETKAGNRDALTGGVYALRLFLLLAAALVLPLVLVALSPQFYPVGLLWDWANALGYLSLGACGLLFVYAGRPADFPPFSGRFFANLHRDLGYVCLVLTAFHIGVLLITEPLLVEHLKPTAPLYMLSGLVSAILMLVLVLLSTTRLRRLLYKHHYTFRRQHGILSTLLLGTLLIHVIGSGYYLNAVWKALLLIVSCAALVLFYTTHRHRYRAEHLAPRLRNTHRHASVISVALLVVLAGLSWATLWSLGAIIDVWDTAP